MNVKEIILKLHQQNINAKCGLVYDTPFQLLVATILSAQTTDKKVNEVTEEVFAKYPDIDSFLNLSQKQISEKIMRIGLYRNKSKSIYNMVRELKKFFNSEVPNEMKELVKLSGVGRKTASVVLAEAFKIPAFPVDTHVFRLCRRIGFTNEITPDKVSDDIMRILPESMWIETHHVLICHGRSICTARNPKCSKCIIEDCCIKNFD